MPLLHLRVCPCGAIRYAPCAQACSVPNENDPDSWRINLQDGAGQIGRPADA